MIKHISIVVLILLVCVANPVFAANRGANVSRTTHTEATKYVTGPVSSVDVIKRTITVKGVTFDTAGRFKVTIDDKPGSLPQIQVGDKATVEYTVRTTTRTQSRGGRRGRTTTKVRNDGKDDLIEPDSIAIKRN